MSHKNSKTATTKSATVKACGPYRRQNQHRSSRNAQRSIARPTGTIVPPDAPPIYNPYNDENCARCGFARWMHSTYWAPTVGADHEFQEKDELS